ncbi:MAG TPA: LysM domain-containing protein [Gaiellaceae bacterium]
MAGRGWRAEFKRYGAPAAFLAAVTIAVLLVRAGLHTGASTNTTTATTTRTASTSTATTTLARPRRYYYLRQGETISDVAIRFDTTVEQLLALNPGIEPNALRVGQRIRVS